MRVCLRARVPACARAAHAHAPDHSAGARRLVLTPLLLLVLNQLLSPSGSQCAHP